MKQNHVSNLIFYPTSPGFGIHKIKAAEYWSPVYKDYKEDVVLPNAPESNG
jgi:hypothetical protein